MEHIVTHTLQKADGLVIQNAAALHTPLGIDDCEWTESVKDSRRGVYRAGILQLLIYM